jgi:rod shape determining protein RodA
VSLVLALSTTVWSVLMVLLFVLLLVWRPFVLEGIAVSLANSAMGVLALVMWSRMQDYRKARIVSFLDPEQYRTHEGYQAVESRVAIGSGGWFGTGLTQGPQKRSGYIPERATDFIFAVVGEELGLVGVIVALGLFVVLLFSLVRVARQASDPYASLIVFGVTSLIFTHVFENVGMTISIMPITGIPLPFFSAGGSFLMALAIGLGMSFRAAEEGRAASYVES